MTLDEFASRLQKPKRATIQGRFRGFRARCPAHDDKQPSFAVWEGHDGYLHVNCRRGCTEDEILAALGLAQEDRRLGGDLKEKTAAAKTEEARYVYTNAEGAYKFEKVRYRLSKGGKSFTLQTKDEQGRVVYGVSSLNGWRNTLYYLPEIRAAIAAGKAVYVNEGEKAVEACRAKGLAATCQPIGGDGKSPDMRWLDGHTETLRGANVVIVADRDKTGEEYSRYIAVQLRKVAKSVKVVQSKTEGEKDDAWDHFHAGHGVEDFVRREDLERNPGEVARTWGSFAAIVPTKINWLWEPYLPLGMPSLLYGDGGIGKSTASLGIAATLTVGGMLPGGQRCDPSNVIILSAEDPPEQVIVPRLMGLGADLSRIIAPNEFTDEGDPNPMVLNEEGADELAARVIEYQAKLVIVDPLLAYFEAARDMNRGTDARLWMRRLANLAKRANCCVLIIHHANRNVQAKATHRAMGSADFVNASRSAIMAIQDPEDESNCALHHTKHNLSAKGPTIGYSIVDGIFGWTGDSDLTPEACAVVPEVKVSPRQRDACKAWIESQLANGPMAALDIYKGARLAGFSQPTVKRAKSEMPEVKSKKLTDGSWQWDLVVYGGREWN